MENLPDSSHYKFERLADGVFAALALPGGAGSCDCGIIDLGDHTLLFDTGETPAAGRDLRAACIALTGRPPLYVINSHAHLDHWLGNQAFPEAAIIATRQTRDWLPAMARDIEATQKNPSAILEKMQHTREALAAETDPRQVTALENSLKKGQFQLDALPEQQICYPELIFEGCMSFEGSRRSVELIATGGSHTPGDCYLSLHDECLVFTADLCFFDTQPYILDGSIDSWLEQLDLLLESCNTIFVPGHGPIGTKDHLQRQVDYMRLLQHWVTAAVQERQPLETVLQHALPEPFASWPANPQRFAANASAIYERAKREDRE